MKKSSMLITLILCAALSGAAYGAVIHGKVYEWSTFTKLDGAIVEINTTPKQKLIAQNGEYSFNVSKGNYKIEARYYRNNLLEYFAEENITLAGEGDFVLDLILFPAPFEEALFESEIAIDESLLKELEGEKKSRTATFVFFILFILVVFYIRKRKKKNEGRKEEEPLEKLPMHPELPEDLKEVVEMISKVGGRITQHELREKMQCSEAKISLMLTDLEDRGMIRKIKKGRGNIIILEKIS